MHLFVLTLSTTNLVELIFINNKTMRYVVEQFENSWLSQYPRPNRCVHDNGTELIRIKFKELLVEYGIKDILTTIRNLQENSICKQMYQTIGDMLWMTLHTNPPTNMNEANQCIDSTLVTCMHAVRCSVNTTLDTSLGGLVYDRDIIMDVPLITNLATIRDKRQHPIKQQKSNQIE